MVSKRTALTPSLSALLLCAAFGAVLSLPLLSGDLGWHIRVGQYVLDRSDPPRLNFLCFTAADHPWVTHEWLSGVIFALLERAGGLPALALVGGLTFFATLLLLYRLGREMDAEPLALAGLLLLTAVTLALHASLRPWLFSNLLLAAALLVSERAQRTPWSPSALWWMVPLLGLWVNLHGGFVVGVGLLGLLLFRWTFRVEATGMGERGRRLAWSAALFLLTHLVLVLNPHGVEVLALPFQYLIGEQTTGLAFTGEIKEWVPIELDSFFGFVYLFWIGLAVYACFRSRDARRRPEALLGFLFVLLTFQARRHLPLVALFFFPVVCAGLLAPLKHRLEAATGPRARFVAGLSAREAGERGPFLALATLVIVAAIAWTQYDAGYERRMFRAKGYPAGVVSELAAMRPGRLFNHYDWAGILAWKAPAWQLFITPVNDAYPREVFEDWLVIANLQPGWQQRFERWKIDAVLMPSSAAVVAALRETRAWRVAFADDTATLLLRETPLEDPLSSSPDRRVRRPAPVPMTFPSIPPPAALPPRD